MGEIKNVKNVYYICGVMQTVRVKLQYIFLRSGNKFHCLQTVISSSLSLTSSMRLVKFYLCMVLSYNSVFCKLKECRDNLHSFDYKVYSVSIKTGSKFWSKVFSLCTIKGFYNSLWIFNRCTQLLFCCPITNKIVIVCIWWTWICWGNCFVSCYDNALKV